MVEFFLDQQRDFAVADVVPFEMPTSKQTACLVLHVYHLRLGPLIGAVYPN